MQTRRNMRLPSLQRSGVVPDSLGSIDSELRGRGQPSKRLTVLLTGALNDLRR